MNKILYFLLCLTIVSCTNKPVSYEETKNKAYSEGYEQGVKDKMKSEYVNPDKYLRLYMAIDEEDAKCYRENFRRGYNQGFLNGSNTVTQDQKGHDESSIEDDEIYHVTITHSTNYSGGDLYNVSEKSEETDFHDWDDEDIEGFYVELEGCQNSDQAEYISKEEFDGDYIEESGRFFARTSVQSGKYEIELGEKVSNKLFAIKRTNTFIHFKWMNSLSRGDEGIIDVFSSRGTFYEKP